MSVITGKHLGTHILFLFPFTKIWGYHKSLRGRKNTQESGDEWWARLDKRIERARARHELAHLGMGTIFLVYIYLYIDV